MDLRLVVWKDVTRAALATTLCRIPRCRAALQTRDGPARLGATDILEAVAAACLSRAGRTIDAILYRFPGGQLSSSLLSIYVGRLGVTKFRIGCRCFRDRGRMIAEDQNRKLCHWPAHDTATSSIHVGSVGLEQ